LTQGQKDYQTYKAFGKEALIQQKKAFEYAILEVDYLLRLNYDKVDIDMMLNLFLFWLRVGRVERRLYELPDTQPDDIPTLTNNYTHRVVLVFVFPEISSQPKRKASVLDY
jgi:hypothetical protein